MLNTFSKSDILDTSKCFCNTNEEQLCLVTDFSFIDFVALKSLVNKVQDLDYGRAGFMSIVYNLQLNKLKMFEK